MLRDSSSALFRCDVACACGRMMQWSMMPSRDSYRIECCGVVAELDGFNVRTLSRRELDDLIAATVDTRHRAWVGLEWNRRCRRGNGGMGATFCWWGIMRVRCDPAPGLLRVNLLDRSVKADPLRQLAEALQCGLVDPVEDRELMLAILAKEKPRRP